MASPARTIARSRRRALAAAAAMLVVGTAHPSTDADFCAGLGTLVDGASSGFADIGSADGENGTGASGDTFALPGAERCEITLQPEGRAYHCVWAFPYRSDAATEAFSALVRDGRRCLGDGVTVRDDPPVNHPDFYDLRVLEVERATVSVSLKDKRALDSTFLFLRVSP